MNAISFIQQQGIDKARGVVEGAPEWALGYDFIDDDYFTGADIQDGYSIEQCDGCLCVDDLKRLVESVDYVLIHGYEKSKEILKNAPVGADCYSLSIGNSGARDKTVELVKLKQAIADYESLFSNDMRDDSHIENHISQNCKVK